MSSEDRVRISVLGPLCVTDADGRDVTPRGHLQQRLLALLVLRRGRVVTTDTAVDVLWPSDRPGDPAAALQNHLFRLRRGLPPDLIDSVGDGYRLDPSAVDLDVDELESALAADPVPLADVDAILERWSGPAYPELDEYDEAQVEIHRLEELRCRAREIRAGALLGQGLTDGLVAELTALADDEPLRERPRELLMAVLAATGRQAEALRVYDDFRRLLGDELGIEPSPALAARHADLLAGTAGPTWTPTSRLPTPTISLVGRDSLAAELTNLVEEERLVSLVGPGGVGKTRLLVEVGHRLRDARPDCPVVLCELATSDVRSVVEVVAAALGIDPRPGTSLSERVPELVGATGLVLLLDNCEHVLEPAAELAEVLLARCAGVRVVVSSRERLRVVGEQVRLVPTLPVDDADAPAVQLFLERARSLVPDFDPDSAEQLVIGEIVRRLDGLPLAIELAAARMHTHDVHEIATGLDQRFSLLSEGYRTSSRHGSLSAAVSWSFGLLDEELQDAFASLAVFAGPFAATAAAPVCDLDTDRITAALAQLVERSLVMRLPGRRYALLETLRAFGADQLARRGRLDTVAERHAEHHLQWVERADVRLTEPGANALTEIDATLPELRSAFAWLIGRGDVERAARLAVALLDYGLLRVRPDVLAWAEQVTAADPDGRSRLSALVWVTTAYASWMQGDIDQVGERGGRALQLAEQLEGEPPAEVLTIRGSHALFHGRLDEAAASYRRAVELAASDPGQRLIASGSLLLVLGYAGDPASNELAAAVLAEVGDAVTPYASYVWHCAGEADLATDPERARSRFVRAIELGEQTGAALATSLASASLASLDARLGDPQAAAEAYRRLIVQWRQAGMWSTQWTVLRSIAGLLARLGRHHDAAVLEGAVRATSAGHRIFGADEAALDALAERLREALGEAAYSEACSAGAELDGDAAVDFALHSL